MALFELTTCFLSHAARTPLAGTADVPLVECVGQHPGLHALIRCPGQPAGINNFPAGRLAAQPGKLEDTPRALPQILREGPALVV
ncbi:hypothetical protein GCM10009760_43670 [Kitasatospora kazusensis]|uniref:Uncharacterized protein n=1 Tax=Kitasatospora kazusensis TaxID=407974 RepID=A0ABN2ZYD8_9ACTN